jgi:hypothetical protein
MTSSTRSKRPFPQCLVRLSDRAVGRGYAPIFAANMGAFGRFALVKPSAGCGQGRDSICPPAAGDLLRRQRVGSKRA